MTIETTGNGEFNARDARRIASRSEKGALCMESGL